MNIMPLCSLDKENNIDSCKDSSSHSEHFVEDYGYSSFKSAAAKSQGCLLFQYLERDSPYLRPPLTNKASCVSFFLLYCHNCC